MRELSRSWSALIGLFAVLACLQAARGQEATAEPEEKASAPLNLLVILPDQLSARAVGCYGNGFGGLTRSLTPNVDRLAESGVRFEAAFCTTPQCQPSRFSLLTGRYAHRHGLRANRTWEPLDQLSLPELARRAGYVTASIGKHHLWWADQPAPFFFDHGFDEIVDPGNYHRWCAAKGVPIYTAEEQTETMGGPGFLESCGWTRSSNEVHAEGYFAAEVVRFLEERATESGDGRPFVCWYSPFGPHPPVLPSGGDVDSWARAFEPDQLTLPPNLTKEPEAPRLALGRRTYADVEVEDWQQALALYYGLIAQIDHNIGRVLSALEQLGLAENTIVVFTSDHGEMASEMGVWAKGAGAYDALMRVPLIVRWPSGAEQGRVRTELASLLDVFPTAVELLELPIEEGERADLDGRSLAPLLQGRDVPDWRSMVFGEFGRQRVQRMVRTETHKYVVEEFGPGFEELYDLVRDPWEIENLAFSEDSLTRAVRDELANALMEWWPSEDRRRPFFAPGDGPDTSAPVVRTPRPKRGEQDVASDIELAWLPSTGAAWQWLRFGTDPGDLVREVRLEHLVGSFDPGPLAPETTYYWAVDGVNAQGRTEGPLWSFTTR